MFVPNLSSGARWNFFSYLSCEVICLNMCQVFKIQVKSQNYDPGK